MQQTLKRFIHSVVAGVFVLAPNGSGASYAVADRDDSWVLAKGPAAAPKGNPQKPEGPPRMLLDAPQAGSAYYLTGDAPVFTWRGTHLGRVHLKLDWPGKGRTHFEQMLPAVPSSFEVPADTWAQITDRQDPIEVEYRTKALPGTGKDPATLNDSEGKGEIREMTGKFPVIRDTEPPKVTLNPLGFKVTRFADQQLSGTVYDNANRIKEVSFSLNGKRLTLPVTDGRFSSSFTLTEGENAIVVSAKDRAGNVGTSDFSVALDTIPPTLAFAAPTKRITNQSAQTVVGSATDNYSTIRSIAFTFNGTGSTVQVASGGQFSQGVSLIEGKNLVAVEVSDEAGNTTKGELPLVLDTVPPTLSVTSPTKLITNQPAQTIAGSASDNHSTIQSVRATYKGITAALPVEGEQFTHSVSLDEGKNLVELVAEDEAGNVTRRELPLVLDTVPPTLTLSSPANGLLTNQKAMSFKGTASDNLTLLDKVALAVGAWAVNVPLISSGFTHDGELGEGESTVTLSATDEAGNSTILRSTVVVDTVPPQIAITSPTNGYSSTAQTVEVAGSVTDNRKAIGTATITVNGTSSAIALQDGKFKVPVSLKSGENPIVVSAVDAAGNIGKSQPWTISYQAAPSLPPLAGAIVSGAVLNFSNNLPLSGIKVVSTTGASASTNAYGEFFLETSAGTQSIHIKDPAFTPSDRQVFPKFGERVVVETAYLVPQDEKATPIAATTGGTAINTAGNAQLVVPAGALSRDQAISITVQPTVEDTRSLPGPLPPGSDPISFADLQPDGLKFNKFVTLRLPNAKKLAPGTPVPCSYWDEEKQAWAGVGGGAVSSDGKFLEIPINHFTSYGFFRPPSPPSGPPGPEPQVGAGGGQNNNGGGGPQPGDGGPDANDKRGCGLGSNVDVSSGNLSLNYKLKGLPSFGLATAPVFTYNSKNRTRILPLRYRLDTQDVDNTERTDRIEWQLSVAGRTFTGTGPLVQVNWDTKDNKGQYVEPGMHQVAIRTTNYQGQFVISRGGPTYLSAFVHGPGSRYGVGWNFNFDTRMIVRAPIQSTSGYSDGRIWIIKPDGRIATYTKKYVPSTGRFEIQSDAGDFSRLEEVLVNGTTGGYVLTEPDQTRHAFDALGRLVSSTDRNGNNRQFGYTGDLLTSITDSANQTTMLEYDERKKLQSITDAKGRPYAFSIDSQGFLTSVTDPLGHKTSYAYGETGHLASYTDPRGNKTDYTTLFDGSIAKRVGPDGSVRQYQMAHDLKFMPNQGVVSSKVFTDEQGKIWFVSVNPYRRQLGTGALRDQNQLFYRRYVNVFDKRTGNLKSFQLGEFSVGQYKSNEPYWRDISTRIGAVAVDVDAQEVYVVEPFSGLKVLDLQLSEVKANYPNTSLEANELYLDKARKLLWANENLWVTEGAYSGWIPTNKITRFNLSSRTFASHGSIATSYGTAKMRPGGTMDREGNFWKEASYGQYNKFLMLVKLSPTGQLLSAIPFGETDRRRLESFQVDADGRVWFVDQKLTYRNGYRNRLSSITSGTSTIVPHAVFNGSFSVNDKYIQSILFLSHDKVLIRESQNKNWSIFDLTSGENRDVTEKVSRYESFEFGAQLVKPAGADNRLYPFIDGDGMLWFAGQAYMFGWGDSTDPEASKFVDSNGHTTIYGSTSTVDAMGAVTQFEKNSDSQIIRQTDANGLVTSFSYQGPNLTFKGSQVGSETYAWTYTYDPVFNLPTKTVDPQGHVTEWTYDSRGNLIELKMPEGRTIRYAYDSRGLIASVTDPRGNTTRYEYDPNGRVSAVIRPDGNQLQYQYDDFGNQIQVTDANGHVTRWSYDTLNRKVSETFVMEDGSEQTTRFSYEEGPDCGCLGDLDQVASITDAKGQVTEFHYDPNHRLKKVSMPDGNVTLTSHDGEGNLIARTTADGKVTRYAYDKANRLVSVTDPLGRVTNYEYDSMGNRTAVIPPRKNKTSYGYDLLNRLVLTTDARGGKSELTYDKADNVVSISDAKGKVYARSYDGLRQLLSETDPLGYRTVYAYDSSGNLTKKKDPKGQETTYEYDSLNRLERKVMPDDTSEYAYDAMGNMLSARNKNGQHVFEYDARNRVALKKEVATGRTLRYSYDEVGNLASLVDAERKVTSYTYDPMSRLEGLTFDPSGKNLAFAFAYDAMGRRTKLIRPNGVATSYAYDDGGQLLSIVTKREAGAQLLQGLTYAYDDNGNRVTRKDEQGTVSYSYDDTDQLTGEERPEGTTSWEYDLAGNRLKETGSAVMTYVHDDANRMTSRSDGTVYEYDSNGNTLSEIRNGVSTRYGYNVNDQLERIETQGKTWQYRYDASGNRVQIVDQGKTTALLNDGLDRLSEYDASGKLLARNVFAGLDEPLARIDDQGEVSYYLADSLGSVTGLVDEGGQVTDRYGYDAWGTVVARVGSNVQPFGFTGRENEGNGLYGYRARYFDPSIGRFTQQDPIGFDGGDNLYRYVGNNPANWVDPDGRIRVPPGGAGGGFGNRPSPPPRPTPSPRPTPTPSPSPGSPSSPLGRDTMEWQKNPRDRYKGYQCSGDALVGVGLGAAAAAAAAAALGGGGATGGIPGYSQF